MGGARGVPWDMRAGEFGVRGAGPRAEGGAPAGSALRNAALGEVFAFVALRATPKAPRGRAAPGGPHCWRGAPRPAASPAGRPEPAGRRPRMSLSLGALHLQPRACGYSHFSPGQLHY